jgi:hypothetical protein
MPTNNAIGIVGSDGHVPIYSPDARWAMWSIHEVYMGNTGQNKYIPKINDFVIEPETGVTYKVTDLNNVTFIPELSPINITHTTSTHELLSSTNDNYRIYFDKSITPFSLAVDGLMRVYSSTATFARIYKGAFIDPTKIISRRYDNSGNFIGHDIPLQMVAFNTHDNYAIKSIPTCNTNIDLPDGELCTVVVFDSNGKVLSKVSCLVEETTFVAQAYAEQKYITQIFLKSAFINTSQPDDINYPVNLPIPSFNPIGVVQYNDGSQIEYPVDGDKFRLYGLDQFVSSIIGHKVPLVVSYRMDPSEAALASVDSDNFYVTRPYTLKVSNPNTSYNVKLFVYPVWISATNGYSYKVYLMNLDRNVLFDVTTLISLSSNSPSFSPTAYGITQRLTFNLNLASVSGIFNNFLHVQTVDIVLRGAANDTSVNNIWEVSSQIPTSSPYYGSNLRAVRDNTVGTKVTIDNGFSDVNEFIEKLYTNTIPLYNPLTELGPLTPTHIEVKYLSESIIVPISEYDSQFTFNTAIGMFSSLDIVFLKETLSGYFKLSVASITVR